jgi:hypothetical protein
METYIIHKDVLENTFFFQFTWKLSKLIEGDVAHMVKSSLDMREAWVLMIPHISTRQ